MSNKEYIIDSSNETLYDFIQEQLKDIDTSTLSDDVSDDIVTEITPEKVYFWTRLYIKEENPNIEVGDYITIKWTPSGEELKSQFITYGKKGLDKDHSDEVINYDSEDDKKCLCLMASFVLILNQFSLEYLLFPESAVMCLGQMLCVISASLVLSNNKHKYLKIGLLQ